MRNLPLTIKTKETSENGWVKTLTKFFIEDIFDLDDKYEVQVTPTSLKVGDRKTKKKILSSQGNQITIEMDMGTETVFIDFRNEEINEFHFFPRGKVIYTVEQDGTCAEVEEDIEPFAMPKGTTGRTIDSYWIFDELDIPADNASGCWGLEQDKNIIKLLYEKLELHADA